MTWFSPWTRSQGTRRGWGLKQTFPTRRRAIPSPGTMTSIHSMKKLWKSSPRLKARPHPIAIASAANEPLCVSEISITARTKPSAHAVIGPPGQRVTSRLSGLSGRKLIRVANGIGADRSQHFGNRFAAELLLARNGLGAEGRRRGALDVSFFDVEVA